MCTYMAYLVQPYLHLMVGLCLLRQVDGLHIRVDRAGHARKHGASTGVEYDRARSIFIGNLAFDVEVPVFQRLKSSQCSFF